MEQLFNIIINRIKNQLPELSLVDEDYGQLEAGIEEESYPVTFPCALVGNLEANWTNVGIGVQKGQVDFSVRLAIDCYDDTHYGSGTEDKVADRLQMANRLYTAMQCLRPFHYISPINRTKSRFYALSGGIKVYEYIFSFTIHDDSARKPTSQGTAPADATTTSVSSPSERASNLSSYPPEASYE